MPGEVRKCHLINNDINLQVQFAALVANEKSQRMDRSATVRTTCSVQIVLIVLALHSTCSSDARQFT